MPVNSVNGAGGAVGGAASTGRKSELGQDAFLQLMVAQMKNQDPTRPADPTEFLGQLAQFSTVSGIESMRDSIGALSESLRSSQVLGGTSLVGHIVLADGSNAALGPEGSIYGGTTVPAGASEVTVVVTDSSGQQVARIPMSTAPGETSFSWDGSTGLGTRAPPGNYTFTALANVGGSQQQLGTQIASYVNSVSIDPDNFQLTLNTDIGPIALSAVRQVI
jgi:flagellar basal-body rod modification protein FlgD